MEGVTTEVPITTAEEKAQGKLEVKARSTLMIGIPNKHQLKFNSIKDVKKLLEAVEKRFGGNAATKKTQKNLLKKQYENFMAPSSEMLDQTFDRLQNFMSQLELLEEKLSQEDVNQKLLRSLSPDQSNSPQLVHEDLEQIHPDGMEEMDLRWQMDMLTMRDKRFLKKTGRKLTVNGNETIVFYKSNMECYNCHKREHFARECKALKNQDNKHKESSRKSVLVETSTPTALVSCVGLEVSSDSTCSKSYLETVKLIKSQNDQLLKDLKKYKLMVLGYNTGLESVEERLEFYKRNESIYFQDIKGLKFEIQIGEISIRELRKKLEIAQKKHGIQLNVDKFEHASKSLNKLIECQIVDNCKKGLSYENYNAVPPPYTGNFMPLTPNLSFTGLDEFVNKPVVENCKAKSSQEDPKVVRKNDDALVIKEWVSDNEEEDVSQPKIEKKIVRSSIAKIEFAKSKQEKTARKTIKQVEQHMQNTIGNLQMDLHDQGVIDSGCSRHMTWNMSYLTDYEEIDEGYVTFRGNLKGRKITRKCTIKTDHLGKFDGKADEGFFVGYSLNSKAFRVFNSRTRIMEENLHSRFSESIPNVVGTKVSDNAGQASKETEHFDLNMPALKDVSTFDFSIDDEDDDAVAAIQVGLIPVTRIHKDHPLDQVIKDLQSATQTKKMLKNLEKHGFIKEEVYVCQPSGFEDPEFPDRVYKVKKALYGLHQAPRAWFIEVKTASTPMETQKPLLKDEDGEEVNVHMYREAQLHAKVDGKKIIVTESSVRRDLRLADEEGIDCLPDSTIFEQIALMGVGKGFSGKVTPLFQTLVQQLGEDEVVHKELGDRLVKPATTASSLEAEQDSGNITKTQSKATPNKASSQGTDSCDGPRKFGEDESKKGMRIDVIDADKDITLVSVQDDADKEMFNVNTLVGDEVFIEQEVVVKKANDRVNVVEEVVDAAQVSTAATTVTITTKEITLAQALEALKTSKPKHKKKDQIRLDEEAAKKLQVEFDEEERLAREKAKKEKRANITLIEECDDIQAKIDVDHQLAEILQAQEQEELSDTEKSTLFQQLLEKRRKHFAAKRAEEKRNKPPSKAQ
nr:hypothetical protein [Tanacetum cinerariifolium]